MIIRGAGLNKHLAIVLLGGGNLTGAIVDSGYLPISHKATYKGTWTAIYFGSVNGYLLQS